MVGALLPQVPAQEPHHHLGATDVLWEVGGALWMWQVLFRKRLVLIESGSGWCQLDVAGAIWEWLVPFGSGWCFFREWLLIWKQSADNNTNRMWLVLFGKRLVLFKKWPWFWEELSGALWCSLEHGLGS